MTPKSREQYEREVVRKSQCFICCAFRGVGYYDKIETRSLEQARIEAPKLYKDRPVAIYALWKGHQVHVENYEPTRTKQQERTMSNGYLITFKGEKVKVILFDADGETRPESPRGYKDGIYATSADDLKVLTIPKMVEIHNGLVNEDDQRKAFKDKDTGARVLWGVLVARVAPTVAPGSNSRRGREPTPWKVGDPKPVRANTITGKMCIEALVGTRTVAEIATLAGVTTDNPKSTPERECLWRLRYQLSEKHGVRVAIDENGVVSAQLPDGFLEADFIK